MSSAAFVVRLDKAVPIYDARGGRLSLAPAGSALRVYGGSVRGGLVDVAPISGMEIVPLRARVADLAAASADPAVRQLSLYEAL